MGGLRKRGTWGFRGVGGDDSAEQQKGLHRLLKAEDLRIIGKLEGLYTLLKISFIPRE